MREIKLKQGIMYWMRTDANKIGKSDELSKTSLRLNKRGDCAMTSTKLGN